MFLTITPNPALDRVMFIEEFLPGQPMRTGHYLDSPGGKGVSVSLVLKRFDLPTRPLLFLAGDTGHALQGLMQRAGLEPEAVWVEGETRLTHTVVETFYRRHSHIITSGHSIDDKAVDQFSEAFLRLLPEATYVQAGGSLPGGASRDFYAVLTRAAKQQNRPVIIDCFGPPAAAAARACPDVLKMSRRELSVTFGLPAATLEEARASALALRDKFDLPAFVITSSHEGLFVHTRQGSWLARAPRQQEVNAAGAGDAVSAMLMWRLSQGDSWDEALRWGAAAGAASVLTRGTAELAVQDVNRLYADVSVLAW